jgi:hypothetical protein
MPPDDVFVVVLAGHEQRRVQRIRHLMDFKFGGIRVVHGVHVRMVHVGFWLLAVAAMAPSDVLLCCMAYDQLCCCLDACERTQCSFDSGASAAMFPKCNSHIVTDSFCSMPVWCCGLMALMLWLDW